MTVTRLQRIHIHQRIERRRVCEFVGRTARQIDRVDLIRDQIVRRNEAAERVELVLVEPRAEVPVMI